MASIVALSGSLRRASLNTALARAAAELAPAGTSVDVRTLHGIPLYDGDLEAAQGAPPAVATLRTAIADADGLLIATPEYNHALPGVLKNAIDWLSRKVADAPPLFAGLPVAVIGASPGGFGTLLAQESWLPVARALGVRPWFDQSLAVSRASEKFDASGALTDAKTREALAKLVAGFAAWAAATRRRS